MDQFTTTPTRRSGIGPIVGIIVILALLGSGAFYFWGERLNSAPEQLPYIPGDVNAMQTPDTNTKTPTAPSDDAAQIQLELQAQDMGSFDTQMKSDASAAGQI